MAGRKDAWSGAAFARFRTYCIFTRKTLALLDVPIAGGSRELPRTRIRPLWQSSVEPKDVVMVGEASADISGSRLFIAQPSRAYIGFLKRALDLPRARAAPGALAVDGPFL